MDFLPDFLRKEEQVLYAGMNITGQASILAGIIAILALYFISGLSSGE